MMIFEKEIEKLMSVIGDDLDEAYRFLDPLLTPPSPRGVLRFMRRERLAKGFIVI